MVDLASVAEMWVVAVYDDLRRAGPDRAEQVRRLIEGQILPWFAPRTTTIGDITYAMVHEGLLALVGRKRADPDDVESKRALVAMSRGGRERSLREAAAVAGVSLATARRCSGRTVSSTART